MTGPKSARPQWVSALIGNWVGIFGLVVAVCGLFAALCLIAIDFFQGFRQPYMGILIYLIVPSFIWIGLVCAGVGAWLELRRRKRLTAAEARDEARGGRRRRHLAVALACAFLFLMLTSLGSYRSFQETESPGFCGALCHPVMKPEYVTYQFSPHSRVRCTECHIGPGASWFVRSKLSGLYQVYATVTNRYPRPIPVPVQNLRPARETCEQCHWPAKFYGWVELRRQFFLPDKQNTPWNIRLLVHHQPQIQFNSRFGDSAVNVALVVEPGIRWMCFKNVSVDTAFRYRYAVPSWSNDSTTLKLTLHQFAFLVRANYHF